MAVISPVSENSPTEKGEGLILARGALSELDNVIDEMVGDIYQMRIDETDREEGMDRENLAALEKRLQSESGW